MNTKIKGISLFAGAGIGEMYLKEIGVDIVVANELLTKRSDCHFHLHPSTTMITGDIRDEKVMKEIESYISNEIELLIATPPCQGLSTLGKNKSQEHFEADDRNYLIFNVLDLIDKYDFNYILIENVPRFLTMYFPYKDDFLTLEEILNLKYSDIYNIDVNILNAKDYGVPQTRPRAIIQIYKKHLKWGLPSKEAEITLEDSIGHLPSIEAGKRSKLKWHYAKPLNDRIKLALMHTKEGTSALKNDIYYPKKESGERIKGFHNTYKRMSWNQPSPARTTYSGSVSSHNNVHPGRLKKDGTYSDSRVLTILETLIVSSMPENPSFPTNITDTFIRTIIGEAIPPLMMKKIISKIIL